MDESTADPTATVESEGPVAGWVGPPPALAWFGRKNGLLVAPAVVILLVVAACSTPPSLSGGAWTLSQFGYLPGGSGVLQQPPTPEYTITFDTDGSVAIVADCKNVVGTYTANSASGSMTITLESSTMAPCPQGSIADEFLADLAAVHSYGTYNLGTVLTLFHSADGELIFDRSPHEPGTVERHSPVWPGSAPAIHSARSRSLRRRRRSRNRIGRRSFGHGRPATSHAAI